MLVFVYTVSEPSEVIRNVQNCDKNAFLFNKDAVNFMNQNVVPVKLMEATAKVGDATGCLDLLLKKEQIKSVEVNSMLSLENCHVRIAQKRMIIEADGHTLFKTQ